MEYEKRHESTKYLLPIECSEVIETPDVRNFKKAEAAVDEFLIGLDQKKIAHLEFNFFKKATFLWYRLEDSERGPKTFERLNGKRIALDD